MGAGCPVAGFDAEANRWANTVQRLSGTTLYVAAVLRTLVANGQLTFVDVAKVMPTYAVYVWHDTGTTVRTATGTSKVLQPQPAPSGESA